MPRKLLIIGGVAAGATAAARARRIDETADITVIEKGPFVSYANCGLPYFLSGDITQRSKLLLQTPESFDRRYRVKVLVNTEALELDLERRRVATRSAAGDAWLDYDALILAQGGSPIRPALPGFEQPHVFTLWTVPDMDRLHSFIAEQKPRHAVIVGGGFIGLELAEAFTHRGVSTTVVELQPSVMSTMDSEFGALVEHGLRNHHVDVITGAAVTSIQANTVTLGDGRSVAADLVLFAVGVKPELTLAKRAGLTLGTSGGLVVDRQLRTSNPNVFAAGDMVEVEHRISGRRVRMPLAGPANRQGRIAASNAMGLRMSYGAAMGTSVVKVFDSTAASTGLTEKAARAEGFDVGVCVIHKGHHADYYPGSHELTLKLVYERSSARLLGAQAFGVAGVDKRIDVLATALQGKLTLHDLAELDLAYAPPYSSANDPINLAAFIGENAMTGFSPTVSAAELKTELQSATPPLVLDVRTPAEFGAGHLAGALHVPVDSLRAELSRVPRDQPLRVYCRAGFRGHLALRILKQHGYVASNVTGGWLSLMNEGGFSIERDATRS